MSKAIRYVECAHCGETVGSYYVTCPCCGSQIPCLDIRFIDARDRLSDEVRKQTGVHMPVYPEKCPVCGLDIVYDAGDEG